MSRGLPRVLVLTGTSDHPFPRLLDALPALVRDGVAAEVRIQSATPVPSAPGLVALGMLPREAVLRELSATDVVITHGGSGSCFDAIRAGHRPIVVARRVANGEILDDHQGDVVAALVASGVATGASDPLQQSLRDAVRGAAGRERPVSRAPRALGPRLARLARGRTGSRRDPRPSALAVRRVGAEAYKAHFRSCPFPHPLQCVAWGEARRLDGWRPEWWLASRGHGESLAGAQVLRRRNPLLPAYLPYGPTVDGTAASRAAAGAILRHLSRSSIGGLVWGPYPLPDEPAPTPEVAGVVVGRATQTGFVRLSTDDDMLAAMRGKWRWALNKALRDAAVWTREEDPVSFVPSVLRRVHDLATHKGFKLPIGEAVGAAFAAKAAECGVRLIGISAGTARNPTNSCVAAVAGACARTLWSHHEPEAVEGTGRRVLWALLRASRDAGCRYYDVAGIDDVDNPGVASFKRGVRPELSSVPGTRWLPPAWIPVPLAAALWDLGTRLRGRRQGG